MLNGRGSLDPDLGSGRKPIETIVMVAVLEPERDPDSNAEEGQSRRIIAVAKWYLVNEMPCDSDWAKHWGVDNSPAVEDSAMKQAYRQNRQELHGKLRKDKDLRKSLYAPCLSFLYAHASSRPCMDRVRSAYRSTRSKHHPA